MLIVHTINKSLTPACNEINAAGLSNLVFSVHPTVDIDNKPITSFIFKDSSYSQACHIRERLGRIPPTLAEWLGEQ